MPSPEELYAEWAVKNFPEAFAPDIGWFLKRVVNGMPLYDSAHFGMLDCAKTALLLMQMKEKKEKKDGPLQTG